MLQRTCIDITLGSDGATHVIPRSQWQAERTSSRIEDDTTGWSWWSVVLVIHDPWREKWQPVTLTAGSVTPLTAGRPLLPCMWCEC